MPRRTNSTGGSRIASSTRSASLRLSTCFFFQAEDGIRDYKVTGVQTCALPILVQRDRDQTFHSLFITHAGSPIGALADLKGKQFAFGDVNSTSGHLMPEYFMRQQGVDPDVIARAIYTGGHDATALAVANGKADAGALREAATAAGLLK